jgi:hypothetical protein
VGRLTGELGQRLRSEKHFIGIAEYAWPAEIADLIDNPGGARSALGQIAAVHNQVGGGLPQILQDCLEGGAIAVNVGNDRDAHRTCRAGRSSIVVE